MADISICQRHQLSPAKAREAVQKVADEMATQFDMAIAWQDDVLTFTRSGVAGTLVLRDREAQLDITLGFMLKAFAGKIAEKVGSNMEKMFATTPAA